MLLVGPLVAATAAAAAVATTGRTVVPARAVRSASPAAVLLIVGALPAALLAATRRRRWSRPGELQFGGLVACIDKLLSLQSVLLCELHEAVQWCVLGKQRLQEPIVVCVDCDRVLDPIQELVK